MLDLFAIKPVIAVEVSTTMLLAALAATAAVLTTAAPGTGAPV